MTVPLSVPSPSWLAGLAGSLAGALFLLPRLAASAPVLALPLSVAGLFSALPLLAVRISGRLVHAGFALAMAVLLISVAESPESAIEFGVLFGLWTLVAGEVLARQKRVIAACVAGFAILSLEGLLAIGATGTEPIEATLRSAPVQAAFDQWAAQVPLETDEAKTTIDSVRSGIVALFPALSVVSGAMIVTLNAIALARLAKLSGADSFPKHELLALRWPLGLVVAFVATGVLLLAPELQTVAWNGLVVTSFLFLLQGLSVLTFFLTQLFSSALMRALLVVASLLGPWAILVALLGLFDQWFDFRSRFVSGNTKAAPSI